jgi:hypothetical protein
LGAVEVEVKDSRLAQGTWNFYDFRVANSAPAKTSKAIAPNSSCHQCHPKNGAVDNTFVQLYPMLYPKARALGTVRPDFPALPPTSAQALLAKGDKTGAKAASEKAVALVKADTQAPEMLRRMIEERAKARLKEIQ